MPSPCIKNIPMNVATPNFRLNPSQVLLNSILQNTLYTKYLHFETKLS